MSKQNQSTALIVALLLDYRAKHPLTTKRFMESSPEARDLLVSDPFAFLLAASIDRGWVAERVWECPLALKRALGHLDPRLIAELGVDDLADLLRSLPYKPRYITANAKTIKDCARQVVQHYGGDASAIWREPKVHQIMSRLQRIYGVGPGIAAMIVNILMSDGTVVFPPEELMRIDVKPDVHVCRVFYRSGLADAETVPSAIVAARIAHPEYPGALDQPAWQIGREFCHSTSPGCAHCPLTTACAKRMEV